MTSNQFVNSKILIVDDQLKNIQLLGNLLKEKGYQVEFATSGQEALEWVHDEGFDLILLDVMMPGMDGFEVCRQLKKDGLTRDMPVIFLTAKTAGEDILTGFEVGGIDYITKPFNAAELLARVATHLELKKGREQILQESTKRQELLHILCHDLMNSIGPVKTFLELLKNDPMRLDEIIDICIMSAENGMDVITLVREYLALDENKVSLKLEPLNLKKMVEYSTWLLRQDIQAKGIQLTMDIDPELIVTVERTSFINSVLNNLLTNAVKFSFPDGKLYLSAQEEEKQVKLVVRDFGIGIPKTLLGAIFEVNKPTTRPGTKGEQGTGFGMPLVKKFVTTYGGDIVVNSSTEDTESFKRGTEVTILIKTDNQ